MTSRAAAFYEKVFGFVLKNVSAPYQLYGQWP